MASRSWLGRDRRLRSPPRASRCGSSVLSHPPPGYESGAEAGDAVRRRQVVGALQRLVVEDPALVVGSTTRAPDRAAGSISDIHVAVALARLERKFSVRVATRRCRSRTTTILASGQAEGKVKKQIQAGTAGPRSPTSESPRSDVATTSNSSTPSSVRRSRRTTSPPSTRVSRRPRQPAGARRLPGGRRARRVLRRQDALGRLRPTWRSRQPRSGLPRGRHRTRRQSSSSRSRCSRSPYRPISRETC